MFHHVIEWVAFIRFEHESVWLEGVYLGTFWMLNAYVICILHGIARAHSITRFVDVGPWDSERLNQIKGRRGHRGTAHQQILSFQGKVARGGVDYSGLNKTGMARGSVNFWAGAGPML